MMHHIYTFGDSKYDANKHESKPKTKQKNNTQEHVQKKTCITQKTTKQVSMCVLESQITKSDLLTTIIVSHATWDYIPKHEISQTQFTIKLVPSLNIISYTNT